MPSEEAMPVLFPVSKYGFLGVEIFFVISGFVILLSAEGRSPSYFAASRLSRLFPAYWASVLLTTFLLVVLWPQGKDVTIAQSALNLAMLQELLGWLI